MKVIKKRIILTIFSVFLTCGTITHSFMVDQRAELNQIVPEHSLNVTVAAASTVTCEHSH